MEHEQQFIASTPQINTNVHLSTTFPHSVQHEMENGFKSNEMFAVPSNNICDHILTTTSTTTIIFRD